MTAQKITPEIWEKIKSWYSYSPLIEWLKPSDTSYVIMDRDEPVAAGFLVKTNAAYCLMECLQISPTVSKFTGGRAIIKLVAHIEAEACALGFKLILGFTSDENKTIQKMHQKVFKATKGLSMSLIYKVLRGSV